MPVGYLDDLPSTNECGDSVEMLWRAGMRQISGVSTLGWGFRERYQNFESTAYII
jgi:hypothetical protein